MVGGRACVDACVDGWMSSCHEPSEGDTSYASYLIAEGGLFEVAHIPKHFQCGLTPCFLLRNVIFTFKRQLRNGNTNPVT